MATKRDLLSLRMADQKEACESLFGKIYFENHYPGLRLIIDCYYVKFDDFGTPRVRELIQYLTQMLTQYVHTLADIAEAGDNPRLFQKLSLDANRLLVAKCKKGELGELVLWMLLEGIVKVPKVLTKHPHKTNTNMQNFGSDGVHAGIDPEDGSLVLFLGESKLRKDIKGSINNAIKSLIDHLNLKSGKVALDQDIFHLDKYAVEDVADDSLKLMLKQFAKPGSLKRGNTKYQIAVFTGYDSKAIKISKSCHFTDINKKLNEDYLNEAQEIAKLVFNSISGNIDVNKLRIIWFVLPFDTIEEFENTFIAELSGEAK